MGCDIHPYVEVLRDGKWVNADYWIISDDGNYEIVPIWDNRNYSMFAILAGVRNYSKVVPITDPRGLPTDVSAATKAESDRMDGDGHTHSWLTLLELRNYAKIHSTVKQTGVLTVEQATALDAGILPDSWCQGSSDTSMVCREWERPETSLSKLVEVLTKRTQKVFWLFRDELPDELAAGVRFVFWFDN